VKWVRWQSRAHSFGKEIPMGCLVVVDSSSDVASVFEILIVWESKIFDFLEDNLWRCSFIWKFVKSDALSLSTVLCD
jgi:hypothetical protein